MKIDSDKLAELRRIAQEKINSERINLSTNTDLASVIEELHIYQAELEAQFEEAQKNEILANEHARRFQKLFSSAPVGYVVLNESSIIVEANAKAHSLLQLDTRLQNPRVSYLDFAANDLLAYLNWIENSSEEIILEMRKPTRWLRFNKAILPDREMLIAVTDITPQCKAERALKASEHRLRVSFDLSPLAILMTDQNGVILDANNAFCFLVGRLEDELKTHNIETLAPKDSNRSDHRIVPIIESRGRTRAHEALIMCKNGTILPVRVSSQLVIGEDGEEVIWSVIEDISDFKAKLRELDAPSFIDNLTQLPNRSGFEQHLQLAFERAQSSKLDLVILYIDIDRFKALNDRYGNDVGDKILVELARRMKTTLRTSDTIARLGSDEFAAILIDIGDTDAELEFLLSRLLDVISLPFELKPHILDCSASIGAAVYSAESQTPDDLNDLLSHADKAMHRAKSKGKGRYVLHHPGSADN